jgi:hypothetical protein
MLLISHSNGASEWYSATDLAGNNRGLYSDLRDTLDNLETDVKIDNFQDDIRYRDLPNTEQE